MNTNTRGRKPLKVKFPTGAFTVDELYALNKPVSPKFCELTARNHIARGLASGKLVKLSEKLNTGKVGAPAFKFQLASYAKHNEARRLKKAAAKLAAVADAFRGAQEDVAQKVQNILS